MKIKLLNKINVQYVDVLIIGGNLTGLSTALNLDSNLKIIYTGAFNNCDSLEKVVIPDSVKTIYGDFGSYIPTFGDCDNLKTVVIGNGLESIDYAVFQNNPSLETVATFWLLLSQVTDLSVAVSGKTVAVSCKVSPSFSSVEPLA